MYFIELCCTVYCRCSCDLVWLCCAAVRSAQFCSVSVGQVHFLANETDMRLFSTAWGKHEDRTETAEKRRESERCRRRSTRTGLDGWLGAVDLTRERVEIYGWKLIVRVWILASNNVLTWKCLTLAIFMPQKFNKNEMKSNNIQPLWESLDLNLQQGEIWKLTSETQTHNKTPHCENTSL